MTPDPAPQPPATRSLSDITPCFCTEEAAMTDQPPATPPPGSRLVLVTEDLLDLIGTRDEQGNRLSFEWREPDEHGWYTPAITVHYDDNLLDCDRAARDALPSVERLAEAAATVAEAGSLFESAWLVPKVDREAQLGGPVAHLRAALATLRAALAASPSRAPEDERPDCAHRPGYEHGHWCAQGGGGDSEWMAFEHGEACSRNDAPPERAASPSPEPRIDVEHAGEQR